MVIVVIRGTVQNENLMCQVSIPAIAVIIDPVIWTGAQSTESMKALELQYCSTGWSLD